MAKIELELSEATIERLKKLAEERHATVERVIEDQFASANGAARPDSLLGLFADEPEVVDELLEHVREMRAQTDFRSYGG